MKKIVTISREYGSGGAVIGKNVAQKLNIPFYDKEIIDMAVNQSGLSRDVVESAEMRAKSALSYTLASALTFPDAMTQETLSLNERLFILQCNIIEEIAEKGAAVIMGSCADYILKDNKEVLKIYLYGDLEDRIKRAKNEYGIKDEDAEKMVKAHDKARSNYYNYHTSSKWGNVSNYDLCINTSRLTLEEVSNLIVSFLNRA